MPSQWPALPSPSWVWRWWLRVAFSRGLVGRRGVPRELAHGILLVAAALAVEAAVLFAVPLLSAPRPEKTDGALVQYLQDHIGLARFATLGPLQPDFGSLYDLAEINVNDLPVPKAFSSYITHSLDDNVDPLIFTGASVSTPLVLRRRKKWRRTWRPMRPPG